MVVGYIVGLGDRHLDNILISKNNGSVVHIDFDQIFDKAKTQRTPEKVPFRLTQCIIDGLGVNGVGGSFRYCSSLVMEVLNSKKQRLLNVLQSFVDDPLVESEQPGDKKFTLLELDRRISSGSSDKASVINPDSAVLILIKSATNTSNLCNMYIGWLPFI